MLLRFLNQEFYESSSKAKNDYFKPSVIYKLF